MSKQSALSFAAAVTLLGLTAGCTSSSSTTPSPSPSTTSAAPIPSDSATASLRSADAPALIVQCVLNKGLMKPPTGLVTPSGETPWLQGKRVVITAKNDATFNDWYSGNDALVIAGKQLMQWAQSLASSGKLPTAVCGSSTSASDLQKEVFANDPAARNPWLRDIQPSCYPKEVNDTTGHLQLVHIDHVRRRGLRLGKLKHCRDKCSCHHVKVSIL